MRNFLFDGGIAVDTGGNGHSAQVYGARPAPDRRQTGSRPAPDRFGRERSALAFDGKDDYIVVQPAPLPGENAFSVSVWVQYDEDARLGLWGRCILAQDGHEDRRVFQLSTYNKHLCWHRFMGGADAWDRRPVDKGAWIHIAAVYSDGVHKLYRDGELAGEAQGKLELAPEESLYIGRKSTDEPYFSSRA